MLTRLGPHSRFGDNLLGIEVRNVFMYSAAPTGFKGHLWGFSGKIGVDFFF